MIPRIIEPKELDIIQKHDYIPVEKVSTLTDLTEYKDIGHNALLSASVE